MTCDTSSTNLSVLFLVVVTLCTSSLLCESKSDLLMIGNSFIIRNDLEQMVAKLLKEGLGLSDKNVYAQRIAKNGYDLPNQMKDSIQLKKDLGQKDWDWVVLQDQSEIPGLYGARDNDLFDHSILAAKKLNKIIATETSAETVLLLTWGYRHGDDYNPGLYDSYKQMQDRLTEGYLQYQDEMSTTERSVRIAPAGIAFEEIYYELLEQDLNPTNDNTTFSNLYSKDGIHPSTHGSYLVACVVYGTLTGYSPEGLQWAPRDIGEKLRDHLQTAAASAIYSFNDIRLSPSPGIVLPNDAEHH